MACFIYIMNMLTEQGCLVCETSASQSFSVGLIPKYCYNNEKFIRIHSCMYNILFLSRTSVPQTIGTPVD